MSFKITMLSCIAVLASVAPTGGFLAIPVAHADGGLYGDDAKKITAGDINDQDYWWSKFDMKMLDLAIQQRQPESEIGLELAGTIRRLDDLVKKYPNDDELKAWLKKAQDVDAKIDPNAPRGGGFKPGCPWAEPNFGQLWVNLQWAQMKYDVKEDNEAAGLLQNVRQNLDILLKPDRMKDYPDDLRKWVEDAKPTAADLDKKIKDRRHH